jgi:glycine cleavage system H lipoate-binding protein
MTHDFLSIYPAKLMEYGLAIAYLLLFIPFWRYLRSGRPAAAEARKASEARPAAREAPAGATALRPTAGWFHVPAGIHLHPGHTWARLEADGLVTVGVDDFAHKLVAPTAVKLPALGAHVAQGEPALSLCEDGASVPMLSPVDGTVVAVNRALESDAGALAHPYASGWLFKVKTPRYAANLRQLLPSAQANRALEDAAEALVRKLNPELGAVLQDGGTPVHGIARAVAGDKWEALAREHFRT